MKRKIFGAVAGVAMAVTAVAPAHATGAETPTNLHYATMVVKAWHCSLYVTACDWRSETIVSDVENGGMMDEVTNVAELSARGISLESANIAKNPEAGLTFPSQGKGRVTWTKYISNNVSNFGQFTGIIGTVNVNVKSIGSGDGPGTYGRVDEKIAEVGAI